MRVALAAPSNSSTSATVSKQSCIAALDAGTGRASAWEPNANGGLYARVVALAVSRSTVYAGGNFLTMIGGDPQEGFAAFPLSG